MRDEEEIREQYEFLAEHLESDEMRHEGALVVGEHLPDALV